MGHAQSWRRASGSRVSSIPSREATGVRSPASHDRGRRLYLSVPVKFSVALLVAISWTALSLWLSQRWLADLASVTNWAFAFVAITFIAYVPGFMNAFLISTLLLDRKPPCRTLESYPGVSILVAAYNEAAAIADTLTSLAAQDYSGEYEVLVLNDGSSDATVARAREALETLRIPPNASVRILDFPVNRGKSAVLNDGLRAASHDLIITIDGDSWVRHDGLTQIVGRLLSDPEDTQAVAGAVMVRNSRTNFLTRAQEWDYFHGIAAVKRMQGMYHGTLVAQGAFSLYRRAALEQVGGWPECVGEDIVVSWALLKQDYRIGYADSALAFTNVPTTFRQFALQRKRWSRGLMEGFKAHWQLIFRRRLSTGPTTLTPISRPAARRPSVALAHLAISARGGAQASTRRCRSTRIPFESELTRSHSGRRRCGLHRLARCVARGDGARRRVRRRT